MRIGRNTWAAMLAAGLALGATGAAHATSLAIVTYNVGALSESFTAFDPALGTLQSVNVSLSGQFDPLILSDTAIPGVSEPVTITASWTGFAGKGFSTITPSTINATGITTGPAAPEVVVAPFLDSFTFDALTDVIGFAADAYGGFFSGHLSDFVAGGPSGSQIIEFPTYTASALGVSGAQLPAIVTTLQGGGLVTYSYIPASTGGPGPNGGGVPEPAAWALLLAGFGLLGGALRTRRAAQAAAVT